MPQPDSSLKYKEDRQKCIELLNKLITPCPKVNEFKNPDLSGPSDLKTGPSRPKSESDLNPDPSRPPDLKPEPSGSKPDLKPNGQVGSLEELIIFLIKGPTNNDLKMKLNDVYKIFNPTARDIVSKKIDSPAPTSGPAPGSGSKTRDDQISIQNIISQKIN